MNKNFYLITNDSKLNEVKKDIEQLPLVAIDLETTGLDCLTDDILLLGVGNEDVSFLITGNCNIKMLKEFLESNTPKVLHNAKFDYKFLKQQYGIMLGNPICTMLIEQVLFNGIPDITFGLDAILKRRFGIEMYKEIRQSFIGKSNYNFTPAQLEYLVNDLLAPLKILKQQIKEIERDDLLHICKLECLASRVIGDIEINGFYLDKERWEDLLKEEERKKEESARKLDALFLKYGHQVSLFNDPGINYASPEQVLNALRKIGINIDSTGRKEIINSNHAIIRELQEFRLHEKAVKSYGENFIKLIHPVTGRIHPSINQIGALSGRAICSKPNLQNIKRDSVFRSCFIAEEGNSLITADYNGCELRIMAELSDEKMFIDAFREEKDLHAEIGTVLFGRRVSKEESPKLRNIAKQINFGIAYGISSKGLTTQLNLDPEIKVTEDEAKDMLEKYYSLFPTLCNYFNMMSKKALKDGFLTTIGGRRRYFPKDNISKQSELEGIKRQARNTPIQGTNADILKLALINIKDAFDTRKIPAKIVNIVHDEIVIETETFISEEVCGLVEDCMRKAGEFYLKKVPVVVETNIAREWAH